MTAKVIRAVCQLWRAELRSKDAQYAATNVIRLLPNVSRRVMCSASSENNTPINLTLVMAGGTRHNLQAKSGDTILDCIKNNYIDIDGFGLCDGAASCSTCHVMFKPEDFDLLPPEDDIEADILDLTFRRTNTSRLGCQVTLSPAMEGIEVQIPNFRQDIREPDTTCSSV